MKFIHIADVHLGAKPDADQAWGAARERAISETFDRVLKLCQAEAVDLLLIAGDLFHKQPTRQDLRELDYRFSKLSHTHVVLIAGNHDYIAPGSPYLTMEWSENVTMLKNRDMDSVYLEKIHTEVYGFSYHTPNIPEARYDTMQPTVEERINILLAHGGDPRNIPMDYRLLGRSKFDYIALGHIHKPLIMEERMAYAGALEPLDKTDYGDHGFFRGEIQKKGFRGTTEFAFVPFSDTRYETLMVSSDARSTNASLLDRAGRQMKDMGLQHIYRIVLKGMRDPDIRYKTDAFFNLGRVYEVVDETKPEYDFERLEQEHAGNLIGRFIRAIKETESESRVKEQALYYGIDALLRDITGGKE